MSLIYEDKTELLRRCFFDVHNEVGLGRREEAYHKACRLCFQEHGIPFASRLPHPLLLGNQEAYVLVPDFVVWDQITVELKALSREVGQAEFVQIFDYLKCRQDRLGLLVNFGLDRVQVERIVFDPPVTAFVQDWQYWTGTIQAEDRAVGLAVRDALCDVYAAHGTGYGEEVLGRLIQCAIRNRGLRMTVSPVSKAYYRSVVVDESPIDGILIEDRILLVATALLDENQFAVNRGLSYLKALGLGWGIAVDFGKRGVQMSGLRRQSR